LAQSNDFYFSPTWTLVSNSCATTVKRIPISENQTEISNFYALHFLNNQTE